MAGSSLRLENVNSGQRPLAVDPLECAANVHKAMVGAFQRILKKSGRERLKPAEKQELVKLVQVALPNLDEQSRIAQVLIATNVRNVTSDSHLGLECADKIRGILSKAVYFELDELVTAAEETHFVTIMDADSRIGERINCNPHFSPERSKTIEMLAQGRV